ncbi:MAG TPA: cytochrome P450 [Anaerolineaceae bacterium]|nr:cytochrome P450 [Anaerolineaceae bacterium]
MVTKSETIWRSGPSDAPLPPLVSGLPMIGSALEMYTDVLGFLVRQYQHMGPIFRVRVLDEIYTVIAGPQANQFMAREGNKHFRSKEFWERLDREMGAQTTLISSDGEVHSRLRQLEKRGYSRSVIEANLPQVVEITKKAIANWPIGESRAVYPFFQQLVTEQLGTLIIGTAPGEYVRDVVTFVRTGLLTLVTRQRPAFLRALPGYKNARARSFELGNRILEWHRNNPPGEGREANLIDDALAAVREGGLLTEADLMPVALGPYIAGLDTAASTAAFLMYALFKHPQILRSVQEEAEILLGGEGPTPEKLRGLDILDRALRETLRRYPIAPALQRTVVEPFEFAGYRVDAGGRIFIGTTVAHFLPELHPDPYRFDIDRYLEPRSEQRVSGGFAPFGLGAHTCLGSALAEVQIQLTVSTLLHNASFIMDPPYYQLKTRTAPTPAPNKSFQMRLVRK